MKREAGRLTAENSRLHQDLLAEADARGAQQAAAYQRAKQLEAQAADSHFAKQQALERAAGVERERDGLRGKVKGLLGFGQHHEGGGCVRRGSAAGAGRAWLPGNWMQEVLRHSMRTGACIA